MFPPKENEMVQLPGDMKRLYMYVQKTLDAIQDLESDIDFLEANTDIDIEELPALVELKENMKKLEIHALNVLGGL